MYPSSTWISWRWKSAYTKRQQCSVTELFQNKQNHGNQCIWIHLHNLFLYFLGKTIFCCVPKGLKNCNGGSSGIQTHTVKVGIHRTRVLWVCLNLTESPENIYILPDVTWFDTNNKVTLETIGLATGRLQSQPLFFTVYFSNLVVVSDNSVGTKLTLCLSKHRLKLSYIGSDSRLILNI